MNIVHFVFECRKDNIRQMNDKERFMLITWHIPAAEYCLWLRGDLPAGRRAGFMTGSILPTELRRGGSTFEAPHTHTGRLTVHTTGC